MKRDTKPILPRLRPASQRLVRDLVKEYAPDVNSKAFRNHLRERLNSYGWSNRAIEQAVSEIQEIVSGK